MILVMQEGFASECIIGDYLCKVYMNYLPSYPMFLQLFFQRLENSQKESSANTYGWFTRTTQA